MCPGDYRVFPVCFPVSYTHLDVYKRQALGRLPFVMVDKLEKENVRVVYQGVDGAYAQQAMFAFFGENVNHFHVERWRDAMDAIAEGMACLLYTSRCV